MLGTVVFISKLCQVIVQKVCFYIRELFLSQEAKVPRLFLTVFYGQLWRREGLF